MLFRYPFVAMGSGCELLVEAANAKTVLPKIQSAVASVARLEAKYSRFREDSFLTRTNRVAYRQAVELDAETQYLLGIADRLHAATDGRFDPTTGALSACWDFAAMAIPDPRRIAAQLPGVGWHHVALDGNTIRLLHPDTRIDLGGLVKEYALDCAVATLLGLGVTRGLVNLGGDLRVVGQVPADARLFNVAVAHPRRPHAMCAMLRISTGAVVSSGDYQRYFLHDGVRYHHILDPRTGYPLPLRYSGVTHHGATAMEALFQGKRMFLGGADALEGPPEGAYIACGESGEPVGWCETPECRMTVYAAPTGSGAAAVRWGHHLSGAHSVGSR